MRLNERIRSAHAWGRHFGVADAISGELPGMTPNTPLPCFFREDRVGRSEQIAYESAYFDAYLTRATGKTTTDVWDERGTPQ